MEDRDRGKLDSTFRMRCARLEQVMAQLGYLVLMTDGWRSFSEQMALYENRPPGAAVAKPGHSAHEVMRLANPGEPNAETLWSRPYVPSALAADWCFIVDGKPSWDANLPWRLLGAVAECLCGMEWGGDWKSTTDRPHTQEPNWKDRARASGWSPFDIPS